MSVIKTSGITPLLLPALVKIDDTIQKAKKHFRRGKEYYEQERYEKALKEFLRSYDLIRQPELQYNIGRCYQKLERYEEALKAYLTYLAESPQAADREEVESWIHDLEEKIRLRTGNDPNSEKSKASPAPFAPPKAPATTVDTYIPPSDKEERTQIHIGSTVPPKHKSSYRLLMWTSLGLSAAGLATGLIAHFATKEKQNEYANLVDNLEAEGKINGNPGNRRFVNEQEESLYRDRLNDLETDVDRRGTIAITGFVSAATLLGFGGLFYLLDQNQQTQTTVAPNIGGASFYFNVRF